MKGSKTCGPSEAQASDLRGAVFHDLVCADPHFCLRRSVMYPPPLPPLWFYPVGCRRLRQVRHPHLS